MKIFKWVIGVCIVVAVAVLIFVNNRDSGGCPTTTEQKVVQGDSLTNLINSGETVRIKMGYYICHEPERGEVAWRRGEGPRRNARNSSSVKGSSKIWGTSVAAGNADATQAMLETQLNQSNAAHHRVWKILLVSKHQHLRIREVFRSLQPCVPIFTRKRVDHTPRFGR